MHLTEKVVEKNLKITFRYFENTLFFYRIYSVILKVLFYLHQNSPLNIILLEDFFQTILYFKEIGFDKEKKDTWMSYN